DPVEHAARGGRGPGRRGRDRRLRAAARRLGRARAAPGAPATLADVAARRENDAVLAYLFTEQLPSWRESASPWVVDGYALSTHPDLCERVEALAGAAGGRFGWVYGRPAVATDDGVLVAFGAGTHIFCLRLSRQECGALVVPELDALVAGEWTR